jgi:hypothetical protein
MIEIVQYIFNCEIHGQQTIECKMSEIKEQMPCPICNSEMKRVYYPIPDLWRVSGSYKGGNNNK